MMRSFALLHSLFLCPLSLERVGQAIGDAGDQALVLDYRRALPSAASYYSELGRRVADQLPRNSVLVVHSAAGALAPSVIAHANGSLAGVVFVDALLPHPGRSWLDTAPSSLRSIIEERASGGLVPPWPLLLPPSTLGRLVPDETMRSDLIAQSPSVPLRLLEEAAPALDMPPGLDAYFVQLSGGYDAEARAARERGWEVSRLAGDHLWTLTRPQTVATALCDLFC